MAIRRGERGTGELAASPGPPGSRRRAVQKKNLTSEERFMYCLSSLVCSALVLPSSPLHRTKPG